MEATRILSIIIKNRYVPILEKKKKQSKVPIKKERVEDIRLQLEELIKEDLSMLSLEPKEFKIIIESDSSRTRWILHFQYKEGILWRQEIRRLIGNSTRNMRRSRITIKNKLEE